VVEAAADRGQPVTGAIHALAIWSASCTRYCSKPGLTPGRLELEITEGVLIEDFDRGLAPADSSMRNSPLPKSSIEIRSRAPFSASQQRQAAIEILDQHAFGDFQLEPARREAGFEQYRVHGVLTRSPCMNCAGDRLTAILQRLRPRRGLPAGFAQDPFTHFDDQAAFFRERDEVAGGTKPRIGWSHRASASKPMTSLQATVWPEAACG